MGAWSLGLRVQGLRRRAYFRGQGGLVGSIFMGITRATTWTMGVANLEAGEKG